MKERKKDYYKMIPWNKNLTKETDKRIEQSSKLISKSRKKNWCNLDYRENQIKSIREVHNRPGYKEKQSKAMQQALNRPEVIAKRNLPENKMKHRKAIQKALNRPEVKIKISKASKKSMNQPDIKKKHRKATKEAQNRPEVKIKKSKASSDRVWIYNIKQDKFVKSRHLQTYLDIGYHRGRNHGELGGFREFSGKKSGYYKGILFQSSWELAFIVYHLEHKIPFERNRKYFLYTFKNEMHKYYPDFIKFSKYVEVKGLISKKTIAKIEQFPKTEQLGVLYYNDIKPYLNYCINKYGKDFLNLLKDKSRCSIKKV